MKQNIKSLFYEKNAKLLHKKEKTFPFQNKISNNKEEIVKEIGDKVFNLLSKYRYGGYNKMNLDTKINYLIYSSHEKILQLTIDNFFKKDFLDIKTFLKELNFFFKEEVLISYKFILKEKQKNGSYKFSEKEIDNHINRILNYYGINIKKLKNITGVENIDFDNKEVTIDIEFLNKGNLKEILNNISKFEGKKMKIPDKFFEKMVEQFIPKLILDFKNIFGIIRFGNKNFSEGTNIFYNLDDIYKYDTNIFLYMYVIDKVLEKNISIIHNNLCDLIEFIGNDKTKEFKKLISYNSLNNYLNVVDYIK